MNFKQLYSQDTFSDRQGNGEKYNNAHNNSQSVVRTDEYDKIAEPVFKNIMGFNNESPLDQNFLTKDNENSMPSNSPLRFEF